MIKQEWLIPSGVETLILGFPCLRHRVTGEFAMFGKYGEIWSVNSDTCICRIWDARTACVEAKKGYKKLIKGDEFIVSIYAKDLPKYMKLLKVPKLLSTQVSYSMEDKLKNRTF